MKSAALRAVVVAFALVIAPMAHAQDSHWYADMGLGYSQAKFYPADFALNNPLVSEDTKNFDAGYKFAIGNQINRTWAIEGAYVLLGKFQYFYNDAGLGASESFDYRVSGFALSVVPSIPLGDSFSIYGRIGAFFSNTRLTVANASGALTSNLGFQTQVSTTSPLTGLGFQYDFERDRGIRLEYENYGKVGVECTSSLPCASTLSSGATGRAIVQMVSANLVFKF
jgi:OOP family OmpA-OmpF porin